MFVTDEELHSQARALTLEPRIGAEYNLSVRSSHGFDDDK